MNMHTFAQSALQIMLGAVLVGATAVPALGQGQQVDDEARRTVSVSGEGTVRVAPDMALVRFGVVTIADDPEEARSRNAEASAQAMNAVRELGIEERYIKMEVLRLQPRREWVEEARRYEEDGFEAIRQVVVEVHDLEQLPTLVATVVEQGANRLENVTYDLDDRDAARNEALQEAVVQAREKAQLMVDALGLELGPVRQLNEQSFDFPRPMYRAEMMAYADAAAAPEPDAYAAGEIEVRVSVQAVFEIR